MVQHVSFLSVAHWLPVASLAFGARSQDPVHKLAWTLDACLKDRVLDSRRLRELTQFLAAFDRQAATAQGEPHAPDKPPWALAAAPYLNTACGVASSQSSCWDMGGTGIS